MIYRYAQINRNADGYGYVGCDSFLSGAVEAENMIPIAEDFDLTNKRWDYTKKAWSDYTPKLPEPPEPSEPLPPEETQADRMEKGQLVVMEAMAEQYEQHQAERLNDLEVQATLYEAILALSEGGEA